jgi:hypothetical protein
LSLKGYFDYRDVEKFGDEYQIELRDNIDTKFDNKNHQFLGAFSDSVNLPVE